MDKFNHGMDCVRYMVQHVDGANGDVEALDEETADAISNWQGY